MKNTNRGATPVAEAHRYLVFRVEDHLYALPADAIAEVIPTPVAARVPLAPKALLGVANLRGSVLPLVSLRGLLGMEIATAGGSHAIVLSCEAPVAIAVDDVETLARVDQADVQTQPANL